MDEQRRPLFIFLLGVLGLIIVLALSAYITGTDAYWLLGLVYGIPVLFILAGAVAALRVVLRRRAKERLAERIDKLPESFSFVFFEGHFEAELIEMIEQIGLKVHNTIRRKQDYHELISSLIAAHRGFEENMIWIAICQAGNHTAILDFPVGSMHSTRKTVDIYEQNWQAMLAGGFLRFADEPLIEFCKQQTSLVTVAAWDRVAQLLLLRDISAHRIEREVIYLRGEAISLKRQTDEDGRPLLEDPALSREPSPDGLLQALLVRGIDTGAVFGPVEALALKLEVDPALIQKPSNGESDGADANVGAAAG